MKWSRAEGFSRQDPLSAAEMVPREREALGRKNSREFFSVFPVTVLPSVVTTATLSLSVQIPPGRKFGSCAAGPGLGSWTRGFSPRLAPQETLLNCFFCLGAERT